MDSFKEYEKQINSDGFFSYLNLNKMQKYGEFDGG